ncbi:MAG: translation initiation factor IF-2, partial [Pyrinomonadaceae bacterium]|nr:translation initiation factor IF-2 [Pyrinomonadaceae bacterium]
LVQPARFQQQQQQNVGFRDRNQPLQQPTNLRPGNDRRPSAFRPTPGETSTPQTTYTPPSNPKGRGKGNKGKANDRDKNGKQNRFEERDIFAPKALTIEERLRQQTGAGSNGELKQARLVDGATVREFAEKLGIVPRDVVQVLIKRGVFATVNQPLSAEMAKDLATTFGYELTFVPFEEMVVEQEFEELIASDSDDLEFARAPVVTVMGHVDHGKTSLLDAIRRADVVSGEAGGITQHIGAYSVFVQNPDKKEETRRVVFLDTPGHEAFTMMRARGAKATDVVILVVAADDGVMPQTIEAIQHAKAAKVPIIVAINKVDKPEANVEKVKQELSGYELIPVEWGGDTEMIEVSAKQKKNLDVLLETVLITTDILDLKASPTRLASGVVLEAKLDRGRGAVATVLVQQGTMRVGDPFIVGQFSGKVRAMFSDRGEMLTEVAPSTPVEVLGLQGVPQAGDNLQVVSDVDRAQQISSQRQQQVRAASLLQTASLGLESLGKAEVKELLIILKADVQGSVEVLRSTLEKLSTGKVKVKVVRSGVGAITESDVLLASATQADSAQTAVVIIGFNVRPEVKASELAKAEIVDVRLHSIIYKVEEEIRAAMIGMLDAIEKEVILGHALILDVFKVSKVGSIAGCRVLDGVMKRQSKARLLRDSVVIWEGELSSLKRFKDDAAEVREGFECGIGLQNYNDLKADDQIECYFVEKIAPTEL